MRNTPILVIVLLLLCACNPAEQSQAISESPVKLRVAVASNFYPTLRVLLAQNPSLNNQVMLIHGSTGTLYAQIKHGAPFDVFLAADKRSIIALMHAKLLEHSITYAYGELVLWPVDTFQQAQPLSTTLTELSRTLSNKVAIADPRLAPYGLAAQQTLIALGIYEQMSAQLVLGNNVNQAFQFVDTANARIGILAKSQLMLATLKYANSENRAQRYQQFQAVPDHLYEPIMQQAGVLKRTDQLLSAQKFMQWLMSDNIQQQLSALGYTPGSAKSLP